MPYISIYRYRLQLNGTVVNRSFSIVGVDMFTGEEHALVMDDSYRDVPQNLSLWAPDYFVVPWILSLMQLHVTKNTSKNHDNCIQYFIFKYNMLYV